MLIGVPRETHRHEHRVGLTPFLVQRLVGVGHTVYVERGAGDAAHFSDDHFKDAGAQIVYAADEVYQRADMVCRVGLLTAPEIELLRRGSVVCAFHHLAVQPEENVRRLMEMETTLIGYEIIQDAAGMLPVLTPFSEMAGRMVVHLAAWYLQTEAGGRGILLGDVPGVPPPTVLILGAGTVGAAAARDASAMGAHVVVLDDNIAKLRQLAHCCCSRVVTAMATPHLLGHYTRIADVIVGAVLIPGERAPYLITEEMVRGMKSGGVIIDVSIDQGGCVETSRPTPLDAPTFKAHGVIHYCVPNMTANIPRTASRALSGAAYPYLMAIAERGLEDALREDPGLARGVFLYRGQRVQRTAEDTEHPPLLDLMEEA